MHRSPKLFRKIFPARVWEISASDNSIYLTFDDGPNPEITPWVLDFLKENNIKATFFCVGANVAKYPDIFQRILDEGHRVGNHTMNHQNGMKCSQFEYLKSITEANQLIQSDLFRPPYGRMNRKLDGIISKRFKIIMWSWLAKDYDQQYPIQKIFDSLEDIKPGDILVFHDNQKMEVRLKSILPTSIKILQEKGFKFELIA